MAATAAASIVGIIKWQLGRHHAYTPWTCTAHTHGTTLPNLFPTLEFRPSHALYPTFPTPHWDLHTPLSFCPRSRTTPPLHTLGYGGLVPFGVHRNLGSPCHHTLPHWFTTWVGPHPLLGWFTRPRTPPLPLTQRNQRRRRCRWWAWKAVTGVVSEEAEGEVEVVSISPRALVY